MQNVNCLHIEASSYCNAHCPGCPRNGYGYPIKGLFAQTHLDLHRYQQILTQFDSVKHISFCGNHGDPMMHPDIAKLCENTQIQYEIHTNGSIGRLETYVRLAELNVKLIFGIDGLKNTNHLYRQGVHWDNVMTRLKTFVDAGGHAKWKFIKFQHNMDQVDQAEKLSREIGCKEFEAFESGRNNMPAIDINKKMSHWILPPHSNAEPFDKIIDVKDYLDARQNSTTYETDVTFDTISCEHLQGMVYVDSNGDLFPCCYHAFGHPDRPKVYLEQFKSLQSTWQSKSCNPICAESCGVQH